MTDRTRTPRRYPTAASARIHAELDAQLDRIAANNARTAAALAEAAAAPDFYLQAKVAARAAEVAELPRLRDAIAAVHTFARFAASTPGAEHPGVEVLARSAEKLKRERRAGRLHSWAPHFRRALEGAFEVVDYFEL